MGGAQRPLGVLEDHLPGERLGRHDVERDGFARLHLHGRDLGEGPVVERVPVVVGHDIEDGARSPCVPGRGRELPEEGEHHEAGQDGETEGGGRGEGGMTDWSRRLRGRRHLEERGAEHPEAHQRQHDAQPRHRQE